MARMRRPKAAVMAAVAALGVIPLTGTAQADSFSASSSVSISISGNTFSGRVSSDMGRCERNRRVILIRNRANKPDFEAGATFTDENGRWSIRKPDPNGRYYVVVPARTRGRYGHRHECGGARSGNVRA